MMTVDVLRLVSSYKTKNLLTVQVNKAFVQWY